MLHILVIKYAVHYSCIEGLSGWNDGFQSIWHFVMDINVS